MPDAGARKKFGIKIVKPPNTIHTDLWDGATEVQMQEINRIISEFLPPIRIGRLKL